MIEVKDKIRILWLSDIHIKKIYAGVERHPMLKEKKDELESEIAKLNPPYDKGLKEELLEINKKIEYISISSKIFTDFFSTLKKSIDDEIDLHGNLDYLIISGDLAFSGNQIEYELLQKYLLSFYPNIPVITIPGNHDCNWTTIPPEFYSLNSTEFKERFKQKNIFLNDKKTEFSQSFSEYTSFCSKNHYSTEKKRELSTSNGLNYHLDEQNLYGIIQDTQNRINFILINSSWFCFGLEYNQILKDSFKNNYHNIEEFLQAKALTSEQGGLIIGRDQLNFIIDNYLNNSSDWFNIVIMHHPLHWLEWNEQYNYNSEGIGAINLHKILEKSDLLLTGHEHLPIDADYDILNNKYVNLKAGMLLEDSIKVEDGVSNFLHNRYSILEIGKKVLEKKLLYKLQDGKPIWEARKFVEIPKLKHRLEHCLPPKAELLSSLEGLKSSDSEIIYLLNDFNIKYRNNDYDYSVFQQEISDNVVSLIGTPKEHTSNGIFCFIIPKKSFLIDYDTNLLNDIIDKFVKENEGKNIAVGLVALDLLFDENLTSVYKKSNLNKQLRNSNFNDIENAFSNWFNLFRHQFFNREIKDIQFNRIAELSFFYEIIPYWIWNSLHK